MTIHRDHPFLEPESERDPVRRLRGRLGGAVTVWTTGTGSASGPGAGPGSGGVTGWAGLTVTSVLLAAGEPARLVGLVDPDSDLALAIEETGTAVVGLLQWPHRDLADAFAGFAPAPGGLFRSGGWTQTAWGPLLAGVSAWAGVRFDAPGRAVGWSVLLEGVPEHVEVGVEDDPLLHRRGRYLRAPR